MYYIYHNTTTAELGKKRGKQYFNSYFSPSLASFQGAILPLQVIQIDATSFDVFPVDSEERKELGTPCMIAAIDCYTRMMVGFQVSFNPSSARSILEVLVQGILPKNEYVTCYNCEQDWPIQGFPTVVLVDNGMDFRAQAVRDFCVKYDIIVEFAPIRTPRYKAFIEHWFYVLRNALDDECVPGTRPLLKRRLENPDLRPELDAILTIQDIEKWLYKWVVDEYHFTNPYGDRAPAPYVRWKDYEEGKTGIIFPSPREPPQKESEKTDLCLTTLQKLSRELTSQGISWEHLKYNSRELMEIFHVTGKRTVECLLDIRDVRNILVIHPINEKSIVKVGLASGWAAVIASLHNIKPISANAWIQQIRILRRQNRVRITPFLYQKEVSRKLRASELENAKKTTKTLRKQKEIEKECSRNLIRQVIQPAIPSVHPHEQGIDEEELISSITIGKVAEGEVIGCDTDWNVVKRKIGWSEEQILKKKGEERG